MILTNDPYLGGVHLNDITLDRARSLRRRPSARLRRQPRPPRRRRRRRAGQRSAPSARSSRRASSSRRSRLVEGGGIVDDIFRLVLAQIRSKRETAGDFRAQIAANATGVRRLTVARRAARRRAPSRPRSTSCSTTPSGARAPSWRGCRAGRSRPRDSSTTTASPTSRCACACAVTIDDDGVTVRPDRLRPAAARAGQLDLSPRPTRPAPTR